ncbi:hypothetical protein HYDPIDRAFT_60462, partial [Hydnomerulius pinastri MD-312]
MHARNALGKTPLDLVAANGYICVLTHMLTKGVQLPSDILFSAVVGQGPHRLEIVKMLIDSGADVHALTQGRNNVLHAAVQGAVLSEESLYIVSALVEAGCDPCARNASGETPLHLAVTRGHVSIVKYLL